MYGVFGVRDTEKALCIYVGWMNGVLLKLPLQFHYNEYIGEMAPGGILWVSNALAPNARTPTPRLDQHDTLSESHLWRQPEAGAEHSLLRCHISDIKDLNLRIIRTDCMS